MMTIGFGDYVPGQSDGGVSVKIRRYKHEQENLS